MVFSVVTVSRLIIFFRYKSLMRKCACCIFSTHCKVVKVVGPVLQLVVGATLGDGAEKQENNKTAGKNLLKNSNPYKGQFSVLIKN